MGYFLGSDMPFTWGLAKTFPIADRWFCSVLGQTDPNRRYLISGTSLGLINDSFPTVLPPNGTIFNSFNKYDISWRDYYSDVPTAGVYLPLFSQPAISENLVKIDQFFTDAAAGSLPQFSLLDPNYTIQSEENPQDVQYGDQFLAAVVNAVLSGPQWSKTLHDLDLRRVGRMVRPRAAPGRRDARRCSPRSPPGSLPGTFARYGFRVPGGVISPYAKKDYVSHTVYDHTSILKTVETKWNLPALTRRDANAHDVLDMIDLTSEARFLTPPRLPDPANPVPVLHLPATGPGQIPPPVRGDQPVRSLLRSHPPGCPPVVATAVVLSAVAVSLLVPGLTPAADASTHRPPDAGPAVGVDAPQAMAKKSPVAPCT